MALGGFLGGLGGSALGRVLVEVGLDTRALDAGLAKTRGELTTSSAGMGAALKSGLAVGAVAASAALVKLGADSVRAFEESERSTNRLNNTLANNAKLSDVAAKSWDAQSHSLQELTGVQDEFIRNAQSILGQFDLTGAQVQKLIPLVVDLSQKMGIDMEAAAKAVGKATAGSTGILSRYGIVLDKNALSANAFGAVMDGLSSKVGGFAERQGKTLSGRLDILKADFDDIEETIGKLLIPALEMFTQVLGDIMPVLQPVIDHAGLLVRVLTDAATPLKYIPDLVHTLGDAFASTGPDIEDLQVKVWIFRHRLDEMLPVFARMVGGMNRVAGVVRSLADAHQEAADKANTQRLAEQQLAGGALALRASIIQLHRDQATLNKLTEEGKTKTGDYKDALGAVLGDQLAVNQSLRDLGKSMGDAGAGTDSVNGKIRTLATQAGLSKAQIKALIRELDIYINKLHDIPTSVVTHVDISSSGVRSRGAGNIANEPGGGGGGGKNVNVNFHGPVYGADSKELANKVASHLVAMNATSVNGLLGDSAA